MFKLLIYTIKKKFIYWKNRNKCKCTICKKSINKLPWKKGWAAKMGYKADLPLCPWCFDKYDIRLK